jgi:hypothetical protein
MSNIKCAVRERVNKSGWTATADNVNNMTAKVDNKCGTTFAFLFDILGNGLVRLEVDGTYALPFKSNGTYIPSWNESANHPP